MELDWLSTDVPVEQENNQAVVETKKRESSLQVVVRAEKRAATRKALKKAKRQSLTSLGLVAPKKDSFPDYWRRLTQDQRVYLDELVAAGFNKATALRAFAMKRGKKLERHKPLRWYNSTANKDYKMAYDLARDALVGDAVNPSNMLLAADNIMNQALEGTPVYDRAGALVGVEPQLDTALRANEQKMKATGMLRNDQGNTRVTVRLVNLAGSHGQTIIDAQAETVSPE